MKMILLCSCVIALLATTGCLVSEGGGHGHSRGHADFESHSEVRVAVPVVEVRPPEVIVR